MNGLNAMKITNIKQGVKNQNRVNVFVDQQYAFSLDIAQIVDLKLKVGMEVTEEKVIEYKKISEFGKLYQRTLEWVLMRPRSEKETRDYLRKKYFTALNEPRDKIKVSKKISKEDYEKFAREIISKLKSKKYLDDYRFAEYYVENRLVKRGISKKRLQLELIEKGVEREVIEQVLDASGRNDEEEILKIIAKKKNRYDDEKLITYLCRQGFSYQLVQNLVRSYGMDSQNLE